jgi:hypothetical protein
VDALLGLLRHAGRAGAGHGSRPARPGQRPSGTHHAQDDAAHRTTTNHSPVSASTEYPTTIAVDGLQGTIRDVNVRLTNFAYAGPDDVEMLLVGPEGQTAIIMADVGGTTTTPDVTLRLDDEALALLPDETPIQSGAFRPTNATGQAIAFNAPAPTAEANASLSIFDGAKPNGTWRLFVQDDSGPTGVGFIDSWRLDITAKAKVKKSRR